MVALYNLASIAEVYERHIFQMLYQIEKVNSIAGVAGTFSKLRQTVEKHTAGLGGNAWKAYSQLVKIRSPSGASATSYGERRAIARADVEAGDRPRGLDITSLCRVFPRNQEAGSSRSPRQPQHIPFTSGYSLSRGSG